MFAFPKSLVAIAAAIALAGCGVIGQGEQPPDGRSAHVPNAHAGCVRLPGDPKCNALVTAQTAEMAWQSGAEAWLRAHPFPPRKNMTAGIVASAGAGGNLDSVTWTLTVVTASGPPSTLYCVNGQVKRDCPWLSGPDVLGGAASVNPVGFVLYFRDDGDTSSPRDTRVILRRW